ncbi:Golgi transport complex subunit 5-domain-containing protein [Neohortaea acidophila]|uniref:Conserved oligomeric Golgi complex subunit 5 n=1 Tax=Neohortaea acidophila TaxID=245834 RepID=A0A6A6PPU9_9PEZI|nr:Golgi transport complex subunit 5-domain-containing protein [Neohortaea acidophila]KAF2481945.1 Golgi transport complex subunit 5-domain-containing protein [Neohortaea acidophila]
MASTTTPETSYIDYKTFTAPDFSPTAYANTLLHQTNNPTDTPLDLTTPLSRALFDVQEIDTHLDTLTTTRALPILEHTQRRSEAASRVLAGVEEQVAGLNESYARLQREVGERYEAAERVAMSAERMLEALRLGRSVARVVQLGRQLDSQMEEVGRDTGSASGGKALKYRLLLPAAHTLLSLRRLLAATGKGEEGEGLGRVLVVNAVRQDVVTPNERALLQRAQQAVREFSLSSLPQTSTPPTSQTFAQTEETKQRTTCALQVLYLLSPTKPTTTPETHDPTLLIAALQAYLQTALTASLASLSRALATLPTLERTLLEVSARCQNIVALEALLETIKAPAHPNLPPPASSTTGADNNAQNNNFLIPLLRHLDTSSLPSYFWRSMASQLSARVQDILNRGGVSARTLRTNKERVRDGIRECVDRGSRMPAAAAAGGERRNWEREAAVMVGSVVGVLGR